MAIQYNDADTQYNDPDVIYISELLVMNIIPQLRADFGNIGVDLFIRLPDLSGFEQTWLSADEAASQTTISVAKGTNFSANEYVLFRDGEKSEILLVSSATATTIVLSSATAFAHSRGTEVVLIPFNQFNVERSTDSGSSYSSLETGVAIRPDKDETPYNHAAGASTDYYRVRFLHAQSTNVSQYSDGVIATGLDYNTIGSVKMRALDSVNEKIDDIITTRFLNRSLFALRREIDQELKRWNFRTLFNQDIGSITEGQYSVSAPSTLRNPNSNENILNLRIGKDRKALDYIDRRDFWKWYEGTAMTTLAANVGTSDTTISLVDSGDFDESGSITIGSDEIDYTGNTESTNTLTGVTNISSTHTSGDNVWQDLDFGTPTEYTVDGGTIYFNVPFENDLVDQRIWMDFYRTIPSADSDADTFDEPDPDAFVYGLSWKIKKKRNKRLDLLRDDDYLEWRRRVELMKGAQVLGQYIRLAPDISHLDVD